MAKKVKKEELQKALTEAKIDFDPKATNAELEALLPEEKKEEETKPAPKEAKGKFKVFDKNGKLFTFSKEEDAKEHARAIDGRVA